MDAQHHRGADRQLARCLIACAILGSAGVFPLRATPPLQASALGSLAYAADSEAATLPPKAKSPSAELTLFIEKVVQGWAEPEVQPARGAEIILRSLESHSPPLEGKASEDGSVRFRETSPGRYQVTTLPSVADEELGYSQTVREFRLENPVYDPELNRHVFNGAVQIRLERKPMAPPSRVSVELPPSGSIKELKLSPRKQTAPSSGPASEGWSVTGARTIEPKVSDWSAAGAKTVEPKVEDWSVTGAKTVEPKMDDWSVSGVKTLRPRTKEKEAAAPERKASQLTENAGQWAAWKASGAETVQADVFERSERHSDAGREDEAPASAPDLGQSRSPEALQYASVRDPNALFSWLPPLRPVSLNSEGAMEDPAHAHSRRAERRRECNGGSSPCREGGGAGACCAGGLPVATASPAPPTPAATASPTPVAQQFTAPAAETQAHQAIFEEIRMLRQVYREPSAPGPSSAPSSNASSSADSTQATTPVAPAASGTSAELSDRATSAPR